MLDVMRRETYTRCTCVDCRRDFTITYGEREFYQSKGLKLPRRCKDCRNMKKESMRNGYGRSYM